MQLHQQYREQGLHVITLNMDSDVEFENAAEAIRQLELKSENLCLAEGMSEEGAAVVALQEGFLPAVNLYGRDGKLRYQFEGEFEERAVDSRVLELLDE